MKKKIVLFLFGIMIFPLSINASNKTIIVENGKKYCYQKNEKCVGFQNIDGKTYFFSRIGDNAMRTGSFQIDGIYYHFNEDGTMYTGILKENGNLNKS